MLQGALRRGHPACLLLMLPPPEAGCRLGAKGGPDPEGFSSPELLWGRRRPHTVAS